MDTQRVNNTTHNQVPIAYKTGADKPEKINPIYFIPIIGQILLIINLIGKALSGNANMKKRQVDSQPVSGPAARRTTAAAQRKLRTTKSSSESASSKASKKNGKHRSKRSRKSKPLRVPSRPRSPKDVFKASQKNYESEIVARAEAESYIVPILELAKLVRMGNEGVSDIMPTLRKLHKFHNDISVKFGIKILADPLTRLESAVQAKRRATI